MPVQTPEKGANRRSDGIYDQILSDIEAKRLAPGMRLPSETEIARQHGVSRPTVREALARLREDGLVRSRQGSGAYVQAAIERIHKIEPLASLTDLRHCFDYRIGLESEGARLAALHRTDADLDHVVRAFDAMEASNAERTTGVDEDFAFHLAVARASQNRFVVAGLEQVRSHIAQGMAINRTLSLESTGPRQKFAQEEHGRIIDALNRRNPDDAVEAMATHLRNAQARLFEG